MLDDFSWRQDESKKLSETNHDSYPFCLFVVALVVLAGGFRVRFFSFGVGSGELGNTSHSSALAHRPGTYFCRLSVSVVCSSPSEPTLSRDISASIQGPMSSGTYPF